MIFTTYWYLIFFAGVLMIYYLIPHKLFRLILIGCSSGAFYNHFAGYNGMLLILILGLYVWLASFFKKKLLIIIGIVLSILSLIYYKYTGFGLEIANHLIPGTKEFFGNDWVPREAPLAISFFVFEYIHYLAEVNKNNSPIKNIGKFFLFIFFFPTLVAGPIKRYSQFLPAINKGVSEAQFFSNDVQIGILRIFSGFTKKFVADLLTVYINCSIPEYQAYALSERWLVFTSIAFRIYLDFSGYSDIAIGCARTFGIIIPENFNWPYLAGNLREFWQRWHISLSSWIRDYIYIPLGGNRVHFVWKVGNLLIVFVACGLWHGPGLNFVCWGIYHGAGLIFSNVFGKVISLIPEPIKPKSKIADIVFFLTSLIFTNMFVWAGWLLFFFPVEQAWSMFIFLFKRN